ncbi:inward rectifier potassium channel [Rhizomicrobium palustre]|uniref:Inward rectifier potassium channel n=1 Tax=Rhizomicrobium palustre TaxID=189966 RepID=A0A846N0Z9_9PROT|nr:inward rectifier potassium channel [Rhizomicrobium palustre]
MANRLSDRISPKNWRAAPAPGSYITPGGMKRFAIIKGQDHTRWTDFYHAILTIPWALFIPVLGLFFVLLNSVFALIYMLDPGGIAYARPGNFWDAFIFSVQTIASINYSVMVPKSHYANVVVVVEAFSGIINLALITGVLFSRFSRPSARILFSQAAVITNFDGVPTLMFRAANQRGNQILGANVSLTYAWQHTTQEGLMMRRFRELPLVRAHSPLFALSWTVMHRVDETSPLYGQTTESLKACQGELIVLLSGTDETLADMVFARHSYQPDRILWNHRLVDILSRLPDGRRMVDLTKFHDTVSDETA